MDNKTKLKNVLRPLVKELVKEALFSEKGILSGIIQECVQGLTKQVVMEKKVAPNISTHQGKNIEKDERKQEEQSDLEKQVYQKRVQQMKEERDAQARIFRASGFSKVFENLEPIEGGGIISEGGNDLASGLARASQGNMANIKGKGIDISGIMALGASKWKNTLK